MLPNNMLTTVPKLISRQHISALQSIYLTTSSQFASYNFREYFLRRSNLKFQQDLPQLVDVSGSELATDDLSQDKLRKWWKESVEELEVLQRASVMNRLYEAPKLVVEGAGRIRVAGGGGAGMEQAVGGGGQPDQAGDTIKAPTPPHSPSS
ncbi:hypothetical protein CROQUDRAFT_38028 [Cronartium quercuum f. sp. fusiforme G11]|uniref:Uncharacterized protein n=1 Tax=Cronartium quercuum f. sp. fusiforme G11 TaxID=708437 RepID=A0A9P6NUL9_9BASI|nr:hypothetical protein CROQUDRAFT_38028 [Cronartium quercuum f. sp. fusiforme G11]